MDPTGTYHTTRYGRSGSAWRAAVRAGVWLAAVGAAGAVASGLGTRFGLWHFSTGFTVLRWSALAGLAGAVISVGALAAAPLISTKGASGTGKAIGWALAGVVTGSLAAFIPFSWQVSAQKVPPIHDITTDTENPPLFVKAVELRNETDNTLEYGDPMVGAMQKRAYPEVVPLIIDIPPGRAFDHALAVARDLGWEVVLADRNGLRIEAVDTTFWFGFRDDVVVRVTGRDGGARVDVRSVSRVGRSDIGANAERVTEFLERLGSAVRR